MNKIKLAFLLSPLISSFIVSYIVFFINEITLPGYLPSETSFMSALTFFWFSSITMYMVIVLFGLPSYFIFKKCGWYDLKKILFLGAIIGLFGGIMVIYLEGLGINQKTLNFMGICIAMGVLTSAIFWKIAVKNNTWVVENFKRK